MPKMYKSNYLSFFLLLFILTGCVSIPVNHYQDGKAIGKDEFEGGLGLAFGRTIVFGVSRIDSSGYVEDESDEGPSLPVISVYGRYGLSPSIDIGGELFTSLGSSGGKINGKYVFSDSLSKWGIAIMPSLGYVTGKVQSSVSGISGSWENEITHGAFILELPLLVSYHHSIRTTFTFGPRIYYYKLKSKDIIKWVDSGISEEYEASKSFVSPAFSFGFRYKGIRPELTLVALKDFYTDEVNWVPYFGIGLFGLETVGNFIDAFF